MRLLCINTDGPEKNIDLHFETNVKENSLLLKLETLTSTHLKNQVSPFRPTLKVMHLYRRRITLSIRSIQDLVISKVLFFQPNNYDVFKLKV